MVAPSAECYALYEISGDGSRQAANMVVNTSEYLCYEMGDERETSISYMHTQTLHIRAHTQDRVKCVRCI